MKFTVLAPALLATSSLAFPFIGNNQARHEDDVEEGENSGFLGIHWPWSPKPTGGSPYPPYYGYPTPTPTPGRPRPTATIRASWYFPTPTPTPTPGGSKPPYGNPDRLIFWHFTDAKGRSFYVYCAPGKVIDSKNLGAKGGPFICGKSSKGE
ncbi:hypothetical protein B0J11DRAFT_23377 [Dendryphion nanum]|uniref:Uncharacterized protein n=1 Tax=Dendryphion nanum TaxID=256645 RepID=A0A9P9J286_9PLEO|nr:hypothetical protein B0J11DRAFT_23377 [Dendryphion nanum]